MVPSKVNAYVCVAGGVAFGIALGVGKIVFAFDLATVLIPLYLLAVVLTYFQLKSLLMWRGMAALSHNWSGNRTTCTSYGFGLEMLSATEGFGILSMASICPILAVL